MTEVGSFKAIEVLLLLAAGAAVVWWQLRDLRKAREHSSAEKSRAQNSRDEDSRAEREKQQAEPAPDQAQDQRGPEPRP